MSGINKVLLLGNLGKDPVLKHTNSGIAVCNFSIATSKQWKDASGEKQQKTEWHDVSCFKHLAEIAGKYLKKGRSVFIEGELQTRSWDDQATGQKKYRTEIIAHNLEFIGGRESVDDPPAALDPEFKGSGDSMSKLKDLPNFAPSANDDIPF